MKVAITGSNGLIGQKLVYLLKKSQEVELIATSRGKNRLIDQVGYHYHSMDLTSKSSLENFFSIYRPNVLINTAAITQVDYCEIHKKECFEVNVQSVNWLVDLCKRFKVRLIHFSTDFVFNGLNGPYDENDILDPVSFYGKSKAESEKIVKEANLECWNIIRTVLVYGVTDNMSRSNIVLWVKKSLENGEAIKVVDDQIRTPTFVNDIAVGVKKLITIPYSGIYHMSGDETISVIEFARKIAGCYKLDQTLIHPISSHKLKQEGKRPPKTGFILNKAKKELDYQPTPTNLGLMKVLEQINKGVYN